MKKYELILLSIIFFLSGCVVRTYSVTKDRVDQNLSQGNLGYLKGSVPQREMAKERKTTRTNQVVEVEFRSPIKFETLPRQDQTQKTAQAKTQDRETWGNRGYISRSSIPEAESSSLEYSFGKTVQKINLEKYTVQKGDTLQKIAGKFLGTTKKWYRIYEANKETLKGPNKIYPGQVLNIPAQALQETKENLK